MTHNMAATVLGLSLLGSALAATVTADVNVLRVPHQYSTIQAAVGAAQPNDIIHVAAGTYAENVVITTSGIRLRGASGAVIDGTDLFGVGIQVRGTSVTTPVVAVEVSGFRGTQLRARHYCAVRRRRGRPSQ